MRWAYYERNCRTSILLGTCYNVVRSGINWQCVCKSTSPFVARSSRSQTDRTRPYFILSASLFSPNTFKTKVQVLNELATRFNTVLKVRSRFSVSSTRLEYVSVVLTPQLLLSPPSLQYDSTSYGINTGCLLTGSSFCLAISGSAHLFLIPRLRRLSNLAVSWMGFRGDAFCSNSSCFGTARLSIYAFLWRHNAHKDAMVCTAGSGERE